MADQAELLADLKALLVRCSEAELLTVRLWTDTALARHRRRLDDDLRRSQFPDRESPAPRLSLVRRPSDFAGEALGRLGSARRPFAEIAGELRKIVHELPEDDLRFLHAWMVAR